MSDATGATNYKFEHLRDAIIADITTGNLKANSKLPSMSAVCETCNLSHVTVGRAFMHLRKKGYIFFIPGKGYYVNERAEINLLR